MFNPNRKQKMETEPITYFKEPIAMSVPKSIQKIKPTDLQSFKNQKKIKIDPVQITLTVAIFVFLAGTIYFILGPISMVAMAIGGTMSIYQMFGLKSKMFSKNKEGRKGPSILLFVLIGSPFLMAGFVSYEGATLLESPARIILL